MRPLAILTAAAAVTALVGCTRNVASEEVTASAGVPPAVTVAAVDFPSFWLAEQVGGEGAEVDRISPTEVAASGADLFAYVPGLDPQVDAAVAGLPPEQVVDLTDDVGQIATPQDPEVRDPHVWLDPVNVGTMAQTLGAAMVEVSPARFEAHQFYGLRAFAVQNEALGVDQRLQEQLNPCRVGTLVAQEPVLTYFARAYAFDQVPLTSWRPRQDPVAALYFTPDSAAAARKAAGTKGLQAVPVDSLTVSAPQDDLLQGLLDLGTQISRHQDCPLVTPSSSDRPG